MKEDTVLPFDYLHMLLRRLPDHIIGKDGKEYPLKIWKGQNRFFVGYPPEMYGETSKEETFDLVEPIERMLHKLGVVE